MVISLVVVSVTSVFAVQVLTTGKNPVTPGYIENGTPSIMFEFYRFPIPTNLTLMTVASSSSIVRVTSYKVSDSSGRTCNGLYNLLVLANGQMPLYLNPSNRYSGQPFQFQLTANYTYSVSGRLVG